MAWILVSWVAYGLWAVAMQRASAIPVAWAYLISFVITFPVDVWVLKHILSTPRPLVTGLVWAGVAALAGVAGSLSYLRAHACYPSSATVAVVVSTYPVIALLFFSFLGETLTTRQWIGVALAIAGTALVSK